MNSNKRAENKKSNQPMSIDEIVSTVQNFKYDADSKSVDKKQEQSKNKKPKSIEQIHKENLANLLKIINNLKGAVVSEENTRKTKIEELYKLVKTKLENDLYLFNVQIVADFLQGYKSAEENKFDKSIKALFDIVLLDVESKLKDFLPENLEINLFFDEDKLKEIIKSATTLKTKEQDNRESVKVLSSFYVYLVLKNRSRKDFDRQLFNIERILAEHLAEFEQKEQSKYLLKLLPEAFLDNNPKAKIRSFVHLYFTTHIAKLSKEVDSLTIKLSETRNSNATLSSQVRQLKEEGETKDNTIALLTEQGQEKDTKISNLQTELTELRNRFEYDVNRADRQNQDLRTSIITQLQNNLRIELNDLNEFANGLQQNDGQVLRMYITNIQQTLNTL
jgi:hypothetical protein